MTIRSLRIGSPSRPRFAPWLLSSPLVRLAVAVLVGCCVTGGSPDAQTVLALGAPQVDTLASDSVNEYVVSLDADTFVHLEVDQVGLDVVVELLGPAGERIRSYDQTSAGLEPISFTSETAGLYRVHVSPYEQTAGSYVIHLRRAEPVATSPRARARQLLAEFDGDDRPGAVVAVLMPDGEWTESAGMADLDEHRALSPSTRLNIGSVAKSLTAFGAVLLSERGDLDLDADVRESLPALPSFGVPVTTRDLLSHTSGYREIYDLLQLTGWKHGDIVSQEDGYHLLRAQTVPQDTPGAVFRYNNTGYMVAADVIAATAGAPFDDWLRRTVMGPAGMETAVVKAHPSQAIPGAAPSYEPDDQGRWREVGHASGTYGSGNVYASASDLVAWARVLLGTEADSTWSRVVTRMVAPRVLASGDTSAYGLGLYVSRSGGRLRYRHTGSDAGYRAVIDIYPEEATAVIIASNAASFPLRIVGDIAESLLAPPPAPVRRDVAQADGAPDVVPMDPSLLVGTYWSREIAAVYDIEVEDGGLVLSHPRLGTLELDPVGPSAFSTEGPIDRLTFEYGEDGYAIRFWVDGPRTRRVRFDRLVTDR